MTCFNPQLHVATALTTAGVLTVSNSTNVGNGDPFTLVLAVNPNTIITGTPVNYTVTVNGTDVNLMNRFASRISTDKLIMRFPYKGFYFVPSDGSDPYVVLMNTPCRPCEALSNAVAATVTTTSASSSS